MCSWSRHLSRQLHRVGVRCEVPAAPGWGCQQLTSSLILTLILLESCYNGFTVEYNLAYTSIDVIIEELWRNCGTLPAAPRYRVSAPCWIEEMETLSDLRFKWVPLGEAIVPVSSVTILRVQAGRGDGDTGSRQHRPPHRHNTAPRCKYVMM